MAKQSFCAELGLRLGLLGSASALCVAAPLADGNYNPNNNTIAQRIGFWFDRTGGNEAIVHNVMGTDILRVGTQGIVALKPVVTPASTVSAAGLVLPHGTAPTTPVNGALWTTNAGLFAQINGSTVGPFGTGGGTLSGSGAANQIAYWSAGTVLAGDSGLTYNAGTDTLTSGVYLAGSGSAGAPSLSFAAETGLGFYRNGAGIVALVSAGFPVSSWRFNGGGAEQTLQSTTGGQMVLTAVGTNIASIVQSTVSGSISLGNSSGTLLQLNNTGGTFLGVVRTVAGTAAAPSHSFSASTNTGMYLSAVNIIGFSAGGTSVGQWTNSELTVTTDFGVASANPYAYVAGSAATGSAYFAVVGQGSTEVDLVAFGSTAPGTTAGYARAGADYVLGNGLGMNRIFMGHYSQGTTKPVHFLAGSPDGSEPNAVEVAQFSGGDLSTSFMKVFYTANATTATTGAVQILGGLGVVKDVRISGFLEVKAPAATAFVQNTSNTSYADMRVATNGAAYNQFDIEVYGSAWPGANIAGLSCNDMAALVSRSANVSRIVFGSAVSNIPVHFASNNTEVARFTGGTIATDSFKIFYTTASTTSATGALVVTGGVGIGGNVFVGGSFNASTGLFGAGSAAAPSISFTADSNTGFFNAAADTIGVATNGVQRVTIADTLVTISTSTGLTITTTANNDNAIEIQNTGAANESSIEAINSASTVFGFMDVFNPSYVGLFNVYNRANSVIFGATGSALARMFVGHYSSVDGKPLHILAGDHGDNGTICAEYSGQALSAGAYKVFYTTASTSTSTGALIVSGGVGVAGALNVGGNGLFGDGSAATPSHSFALDNDTGMYRIGSNTLGFALGGALALSMSSGGAATFFAGTIDHVTIQSYLVVSTYVDIGGSFRAGGDSQSSPGHTWSSNTNTGMFRQAADTIGFSAGGTEQVRVTTSGLVILRSVAYAITTKTTSFTFDASNQTVLADCTSGNQTGTLPDATTCSGRKYTFKKVDATANTATLATTGGQTIDGASTLVTGTQYVSYDVISNGTNWSVV